MAASLRLSLRSLRSLSVRNVSVHRSFVTSRPMMQKMEVDKEKFFNELSDDLTGHDVRMELDSLRRQLRQIDAMTASEKPRAIDFAHYRKIISRPGLVDEAEKAYAQALKDIDNMQMDVDSAVKESDEKFAAILKNAEEMMEASKAAKIQLEQDLVKCRQEADQLPHLTIEDELKKHPELAKEIESDIDNNRWFV